MKLVTIAISLVLLASCSRYDIEYSNKTKVIGHGGMGITHDYPLNSFESVALALNKGADGIELDVQMTKDSVLVAFHDETLEQNTSLKGKIYQYTWDELKDVEYDKSLYSNYRLISLDDLFSNLTSFNSKDYFFDIKTITPDTTGAHLRLLARQLIKTIDKYELINSVLEIRSAELGLLAKQLNPSIEVFVYREWSRALAINRAYEFDGITIDVDLLTQTRVDSAHALGYKIAVINTHSIERNDLAYVLGVDYNQTDMVSYVLKNR